MTIFLAFEALGNVWSNLALNNTKALKGAGDAFKRIYVKKDVHPSLRKEWKRLSDAETAERRKPENAGCTIRFDRERRVLLRNDVIIDKWNPSFLYRVNRD